MNDFMWFEIQKAFIQLFVLSAVGGFLSNRLARWLKDREMRIALIRDFAKMHGSFLSIRYQYNAMFLDYAGRRETFENRVDPSHFGQMKNGLFEKVCDLIGEFNGIRPLIETLFIGGERFIPQFHQFYQAWRREIASDRPIYQSPDGESDRAFKDMRTVYSEFIVHLKNQV